jgi:chromosome segregation ATPase
LAPTVMELRNMAEEAIAAVTQSNMNRTASMEDLAAQAGSTAMGNSNNPTGNNNDNKPTYSKRRKKPRLSDCESKLALLKAENEQLKRHLQNVSNKAHKFDMEKEEAGKQIARLMDDPNTAPREMELSVRKFSDMYSDYGINRQQELSFHLEQLQR